MHEELLCEGSRSSRAVGREQVGVDIAFFAYSIWLIAAGLLGHKPSIRGERHAAYLRDLPGIHSPIPSTRSSRNAH
jgi:hypothetical protein